MVLPRPEGGFFTTEAPDRTYKTERGAKQAERMFQNPQMWQGWTVGRPRENQVNNLIDHAVDTYEDVVSAEMGGVDLNTNEEDFFEEEEYEEEEEEEENEDPFISWYELPRAIRDLIHDSNSNNRCIQRLLSNGWTGVYLSDIIEDFGQETVDLYL